MAIKKVDVIFPISQHTIDRSRGF